MTVLLTREQADLLAGWIATGRQLDRIIAQMQRLSMRATERLLKELPPRQRQRPAMRPRGKRRPPAQ